MSADRYVPLTLTPERQRQKLLEAMVSNVLEPAEHQPGLFILEDLHWTDPSTLEFLNLLIEQVPTASILLLVTCRWEFDLPWGLRPYLTPLPLNRLTRAESELMIHRMTGGTPLPAPLIAQLVAKTDGVPLFIEEMTKAILESGFLQDANGQDTMSECAAAEMIPTTLHDSLMSRLDKLGAAKRMAQLGATIGRQFSYELLQAIAQVDEAMLHTELKRLVEAELLYQRGVGRQAIFTFKHALIQDAAYQSLLKRTRQQVHNHIAQALETQFPETAAAQPELLAHHLTEAALHAQAVGFWQQAGEQAIQRSAHAEAIAHLTKGLELLRSLPDTPERTLQEVIFQRHLGVSLLATKGFAAPEVEVAYGRARELCQRVGDASHIFPVLFGLWGVLHRPQRLANRA